MSVKIFNFKKQYTYLKFSSIYSSDHNSSDRRSFLLLQYTLNVSFIQKYYIYIYDKKAKMLRKKFKKNKIL